MNILLTFPNLFTVFKLHITLKWGCSNWHNSEFFEFSSIAPIFLCKLLMLFDLKPFFYICLKLGIHLRTSLSRGVPSQLRLARLGSSMQKCIGKQECEAHWAQISGGSVRLTLMDRQPIRSGRVASQACFPQFGVLSTLVCQAGLARLTLRLCSSIFPA